MPTQRAVIAFDRGAAVAIGQLVEVAGAVRRHLDVTRDASVLIFDAITSEPVDIDFRGTVDEVRARLMETQDAAPTRPPGRPRLGVIAREVTLLPAHWEWLSQQQVGASATLRRLVDAAGRADSKGGAVRVGRDATYRFMSHLAGDYPGFEAATRALYAGDNGSFRGATAEWPHDVREHLLHLSEAAFS
ncbi:MAG: DUF2239 family protein [Gemmatimonadales bacterium]